MTRPTSKGTANPRPTLSVRAVLTPEIQREVIEQWASQLGWKLHYESERSGSELRGRSWSVDASTELSFFEDHLLGVYFVYATGERAEEAAQALRAVAAFRDLDEVIEEAEAARDPAARIASLGPAVRAVSPEAVHPRLLSLLEARLGDPNPSVRRAALVALGMLEWPEIDRMLRPFEADPVLAPGIHLRRWAKARVIRESSADSETRNPDILLGRASAAIAARAWERALAALGPILALSATRERAYALRAAVRRAEGRPFLAYADALTAVALGRRHDVDVEDARALAEELCAALKEAARGPLPGEDLTSNLAALFGAGRRAEVEEIAEGLVAVPSGQEDTIRFCQGLAAYDGAREHARLGRRAEALDDLQRAIDLDRRWAARARKDAPFKPLQRDPRWKRIVGR